MIGSARAYSTVLEHLSMLNRYITATAAVALVTACSLAAPVQSAEAAPSTTILVAKQKRSVPKLTLAGATSRTIAKGKKTTLTGKVTYTKGAKASKKRVTYQWQQLVNSTWKNVKKATKATYTTKATSTAGTKYRLVVKASWRNKGYKKTYKSTIWSKSMTIRLKETTPPYGSGSLGQVRKQILSEVNAQRAKQKLAPLTLSSELNGLAQGCSERQAQRKKMAHCNDLMKKARTSYNHQATGENVAMGYGFTAVTRAWMDSKGHRENILRKQFTHIGIGYKVGKDGLPYYTQTFGG